MMNPHKEKKVSWYRLDTSAKIYPALESPENPTIFRVSMTLQENIDETILLKALTLIKPRFPYYNVHLKTGIFWNYLEHNDNPFRLWPEIPFPCERLYRIYNNGYLYLVRIYKKRIIVEFSHVLTDGSGAMEFLKTLVTHYLILTGKLLTVPEGIMNIHESPAEEEFQDAFLKVMELEKDRIKKSTGQRTLFNKSTVFKIRDKFLPLGKYHIITGIIPLDDLKSIAKRYQVKITELLGALYIEALIHIQHEQVKNKSKHKPIGLEIPVNMRSLYPIKSMRNFSLFVVPRTDPTRIYTFEDITQLLKSYMKTHITKDHLFPMVRDNCGLGENKFLKYTPVNIKNFVIQYLSNTQGHSQFSGIISNLGPIQLADELKEHIDEVGVLLGRSYHSLTGCAVLGYKQNIHINFGRVNKEPFIEKHMFRRLVELGAHVKIRSN